MHWLVSNAVEDFSRCVCVGGGGGGGGGGGTKLLAKLCINNFANRFFIR